MRWNEAFRSLAVCGLLLFGSDAAAQISAPISAPAVLNTNADSDSGADSFPHIATDGLGTWLAVWATNDDLGGTIGGGFDVLFARSTDDGATWTAPAALNTNAATNTGITERPLVATDRAGQWVAAWVTTDPLGATIGTDFDVLVSRSSDNGATWSTPVPLNSNASSDTGDDRSLEMSTDRLGNWVAVWISQDDLGATIGTDRDVLTSRSADNGATWTATAILNSNAATDTGVDRNPHVATDRQGTWMAVWNSDEDLGGSIGTDRDILLSLSADNGATWSAPAALNSNAAADTASDNEPHIEVDAAGTWLVAWRSDLELAFMGATNGTDGDIVFARSLTNGASWSAPALLNANAFSDDDLDFEPSLSTDDFGNWLAVWSSTPPTTGPFPGMDTDVLIAQSTDAGLTWTQPEPLNTNAVTDTGTDAHPKLATDGLGNWVGVWYSAEDLGGTAGVDFDIFFARFEIPNGSAVPVLPGWALLTLGATLASAGCAKLRHTRTRRESKAASAERRC